MTSNVWWSRNIGREYTQGNADITNYGIDKSRIVHSKFFRALQAKAQVFNINEHDFFRTRLTHSIEVADVGMRIIRDLENNDKIRFKDTPNLSIELIESICLAHDIGHPAFGHAGEQVLQDKMLLKGGFEGNGQTFRVLTKLGEYYENNGFNLTRRALLGVMKYPAKHAQFLNAVLSDGEEWSKDKDKVKCKKEQQEWMQKNLLVKQRAFKCIHDTESQIFDWVLEPLAYKDKKQFNSIKKSGEKWKTSYKSFDCSIMELADDIAYGIYDLEDSLAMGLISKNKLEELEDDLQIIDDKNLGIFQDLCSDNLSTMKKGINNAVQSLIRSLEIIEIIEFDEPLLRFNVSMTKESQKAQALNTIKNFVYNTVIANPRVQRLEHKNKRMLEQLFDLLESNPKGFLPVNLHSRLEQEDSCRVICDYLASMTDNEASLLYKNMFIPHSGTVFSPV
ncbi:MULTISPECIES: anti-phage deoxyguanosine triphosphatase [Cysteiniphilum]|uniref:Deoxyguanosinetriphosphate triphosphohydrolase-like protein n=1 Tax=Cysteiniphilum litorale TaxID=2056700 RepID=A0A8J2Z4I8_9GAMM|nr:MULTISPECIES: anti-phage deoxyguanosine triphosphatase [Cysteiniphilum]GGF97611.1 deoxyguanosinetriphosphate triphosphohydrolase-like protein [Cysteiniphilum litorale]